MKKLIALIAIIAFFPSFASAAAPHDGRIYLQVEEKGEAWYVNPLNGNRYFLGKPDDAYNLMRNLGLGITDANIAQIPVGLLASDSQDSDQDGLSDLQETALNTDMLSPDSDNDDYSDYAEIENWKNPNGLGALAKNTTLINRLKGRILLQVEKHGEAWYVNPANGKRYFLGRASDAFAVMRALGIGITNANLAKIEMNYVLIPFQNGQNYSISYPTTWVRDDNADKLDSYMTMPTVDYQTFTVPGENTFIKVSVLIPEKASTLQSLYINSRQQANPTVDQDIYIGVKPGKRQYFKYPQPATVFVSSMMKDVNFNKGAEFFVNIMISNRKFVHIYMAVPEETDIARYSKMLDQMLATMKVYE